MTILNNYPDDTDETIDLLLTQLHNAGYPAEYLTPCEAQVMAGLLRGLRVSILARQLQRDIRTISAHKHHAMQKLGLSSNAELQTLGGLLLPPISTPLGGPPLTPAENRVLACLYRGWSLTHTARALQRSIKTVSAQKRQLMKKLGVDSEVALFALERRSRFSPPSSSSPIGFEV
jgi:DNA-binding NarL/FixJ family response regulator